MEVIQGTLDFLILRTLAGGEPRHGFEILRWILDQSDGVLQIEEGSLYPALHRMEKGGWIESTWGVSDKGRRAKYYRISTAGRDRLDDEQSRWDDYVQLVRRLGEGVS